MADMALGSVAGWLLAAAYYFLNLIPGFPRSDAHDFIGEIVLAIMVLSCLAWRTLAKMPYLGRLPSIVASTALTVGPVAIFALPVAVVFIR
jgi:hypothetical protein